MIKRYKKTKMRIILKKMLNLEDLYKLERIQEIAIQIQLKI
jgi:hypothetical protein